MSFFYDDMMSWVNENMWSNAVTTVLYILPMMVPVIVITMIGHVFAKLLSPRRDT